MGGRWFAASVVVAAACSGGGDDKSGDKAGTQSEDLFTHFVDPQADADGDFGCFTPAEEPTWLTAEFDSAKQASFPVEGFVEDFENATAVASAPVDVFWNDDPTGTPDATGTSDVNGVVAVEAPSCTPVSYRVNPVAAPTPTRETVKVHQTYGFPAGASITGASYVSVSDTTYQLIPGILGVTIQPGSSIIAGTAYDCGRDPEQASDDPAGKIEGVQVVVIDRDGNIPDTLGVNYFIEDFPARDQKATSADGLWVASNVPPGPVTVQMWGQVGGELVLLGATEVDAQADGIEIANIYAGYGDGVKAPASCAAN